MTTLSPEVIKVLPILKALPAEEKQEIIHILKEDSVVSEETDTIIGFTRGDVKIIGDIVSPATDDNDWEVMQ